ncbi:MAG: ATP-binding cassette domain-containing protein [Bdellovibrionales bacterium]|nr:ATP-binding cassette domain-containing protein [Bdellovibrionales bacterium]
MSYIKNLICNQGDFKLDIPFMEWPDKGVSVLTGPSGSGKSTLALALCGLKKVEKGFQWIFKDQDMVLLSPPDRNISLMFQSLELFPHLSAEQNILFPAQARKIDKQETQKRMCVLQEHLKLFSFLKKPVFMLSGGEKQRVALARALIVKPRFLILDEPFSSLDGQLRKQAATLIKNILEWEKCPTLLISHSEEEIKTLAQKIFYIHTGKLQLAGV